MKIINWLFGIKKTPKQEQPNVFNTPNFRHVPKYQSDADYVPPKKNNDGDLLEDIATAALVMDILTPDSNDNSSSSDFSSDNSSSGFDGGFDGGGFSGGGAGGDWNSSSDDSSSSSFDSGNDSSSSNDY